MTHRNENKVTLRDLDKFFLNGALYGVAQVGVELAGAAKDRAITHGLNHAYGALVGYETEWQRALLITTNKRPSRQGHVVATTDHPASMIDYGDAVSVTLKGTNPQVVNQIDGEVFGWDDEGLELEDGGGYFHWDEIESIEVDGATVWSCYSGDERRDYDVTARSGQ